MAQKLFINIAVKDINRTRYFFESLGFEFDSKFSNEKGLCLILGDNFYGMLLMEEFFQSFTNKPISNAKELTEVLIALQFDSVEEVHRIVDKALELGAHEYNPAINHGFMFTRVFEDLDGHQWEIYWMDEIYKFDENN